MIVKGKKIRITEWVYGEQCALRVEVEAVIPDADTSEPCLEPDTARYLDQLQELANAGNLEELEKHGTLYIRRTA